MPSCNCLSAASRLCQCRQRRSGLDKVETNLLAFLSGADVCIAMPRTANGMRPHRSRQAIIVPRLLTKPFAPSSRDLSLSVSLAKDSLTNWICSLTNWLVRHPTSEVIWRNEDSRYWRGRDFLWFLVGPPSRLG